MPAGRGVASGVLWVPQQGGKYWGGGPAWKPAAIMWHVMQGYQRTMIDWAKTGSVNKSAHLLLGRTTMPVQTVSINDKSWAAGATCSPTWAGLPPGYSRSVNHLVLNIESEGFSEPPGYGYDYIYSARRPWPEDMLDHGIRWCAWAMDVVGLAPSRQTLIGHFETDGCSRPNDPGPAFPWDVVVAGVAREMGGTVEPPAAGHSHPEPLATQVALNDLAARVGDHIDWHATVA